MIKNGEAQQLDQMKSAYANTQILDRLFNQNSVPTNNPGSTKKRTTAKVPGGNASAVVLAK